MQENNRQREEKLEAHDIGAGVAAQRAERPHGKVYRWLDNFWYHYKWPVLIGGFFAIVLLICILQMCGKESEGDINLVLAGPYSVTADEATYNDLQKCLATYLPRDYNEDGEKKVDLAPYTIYSEEQIKAANGEVNTSSNTGNYNTYTDYLTTGDAGILFLDSWLFEELVTKTAHLQELTEVVGKTPDGAILDANGKCYGVRLGDTALYRENSAIRVLPEDTVICLMKPMVYGEKNEWSHTLEYLRALLK